MRISVLTLTIVAATLLLAQANAQKGAGKKETLADKVKELQKERIATLKTLVKHNTNMYQSSRGSYEAVLEAKVLVFEAELEAAEKESDRITLYKNLVDVLKDYEAVAKRTKESGQGMEASVLKIKARRLAAEIHLEQAQTKNPISKPQQKVVVIHPQVKDVPISHRYAGQISSRRHINIRSLMSGYIEEIQVKEGQAVKKGDVLFKVAPTLYKAKLDAELAEVQVAELELKNAERLFEKKVVSSLEVGKARAIFAKAQAKANLAKAELEFATVRAPFDGIIDRLQKKVGSLITEQDTLTTLSDNSVMWVYFHVPQARYLEQMAGEEKPMEEKIELVLANGSKFSQTGKLGAIEAEFNHETGTIPYRADFPNPDGLLRHGMTGKVMISQTLNNAIVIPEQATFEQLRKRYVYVIDKDDVAHAREIVVQYELPDFFVIHSGIGGDDQIVSEGIRHVRVGEKVKYELR